MSDWTSISDTEAFAQAPERIYELYARSHAEAPVRWDPTALGIGAWLISSHPLVASLLRDVRLSADRSMAYRLFLPQTDAGTLVGNTIAGMLAFKDPPDHTRLRGLVSKAFTPSAVELMRGHIEALVESLLDDAVAKGGSEIELMSALAYPLPVAVICRMLGMPVEDLPRVRPWLEDYARFFGSLKGLKRILASMPELRDYFDELFRTRRERPQSDLLSALVEANEAGDRLSGNELFETVSFLFLAGHHTTTNLIGNGMLAMVRAPEQLERLRREPSLVDNAVEELLRFDSAVQLVGRVARERMNVAGQDIEAGSLVILLLGAANRDPNVFPNPGQLDVGRSNASKHLALGMGPHFCLGAPLARLEGRIAFSALVRRFRTITLAGEPTWTPNLSLRGLDRLPLRCTA